MSFSMASMYGDFLLGSNDRPEAEETGEIKNKVSFHEIKEQLVDEVKEETKEEEEDLPPLRVESIYNMTFLQRPQTSIVTHGEVNKDNSMRIDEEDEMAVTPLKEGNGNADIWIAEESEENNNSQDSLSPYRGSTSVKASHETPTRIKNKTSNAINCCTANLVW